MASNTIREKPRHEDIEMAFNLSLALNKLLHQWLRGKQEEEEEEGKKLH